MNVKIILIITIALVIGICVYLSYKKKFKGAVVCACLAAVLGFSGQYIVEYCGNTSEKEEDKDVDDISDVSSLSHEHKSATEEKENITDATCLNTGSYELVSYCECGEELSRETFTTEPHGHNYIATITAPSCEETGFTTYTCSRCGNSYTDDYIDALGHDKIDTVTEPSCTATGFTTYTCSRCGNSYTDDYIDALGHDNVDTVTEPSCNEKGFTTHTCNRCGDSYTDAYVDALGHDFVGGICTRCGAVNSEYEPLIMSQANELINCGDYDGAFNIVIKALDIIDSDSLRQLLSYIQAMQEKDLKCTAKNVDFITRSGVINSSDQTDTYSLEAPITGYYRFDVSDMISGFFVKVYIYDSMGAKIGGGSGLGNENGVTCELVQGNSYTVEVKSHSNTGSYTLTIGQQKEIIDISTKEIIYDSIEYKDQQNEYTFIPSIDGTYRFDFLDVVNGFTVKCYVYDSLGYKVGGGSGYGNENGVTVELAANEVYTIKVIQYNNKGTYTLAIGKQQATQDLTGQNSVYGDISYTNQKNIYIYTPSSTGKYVLSLHNMISGFSVKLYVYDSLGYKVEGGSGYGNDKKITVELTEGETYTIHLIQNNNTGSYDMDILRKDG